MCPTLIRAGEVSPSFAGFFFVEFADLLFPNPVARGSRVFLAAKEQEP